jgi:hypothetical protein
MTCQGHAGMRVRLAAPAAVKPPQLARKILLYTSRFFIADLSLQGGNETLCFSERSEEFLNRLRRMYSKQPGKVCQSQLAGHANSRPGQHIRQGVDAARFGRDGCPEVIVG